MNTFSWPWQYSFPPFFTLQTNKDVRKVQLDAWCSLIVSWSKYNGIVQIDVTEASSLPVFKNESINRSFPPDAVVVVLDELAQRGNLEWIDKTKKRAFIYWRSPAEWGKHLLAWAQNSGHGNSVCTFYELLHGEETSNEDFHGLDEAVLKKALLHLESTGKAELMELGDNQGVKFL